MRAYTLGQTTIEAVGNLTLEPQTSPHIQLLLPEAFQTPTHQPTDHPLDDQCLTPADYTEFYAMLPPPRKARSPLGWDAEKREPNWKSLTAALRRHQNSEALAALIALRQRSNRRKQGAPPAPPKPAPINASRIVDALILLGLETLNERVTHLEFEGSKKRDAGQGGDKLPNSGRRKTAAL